MALKLTLTAVRALLNKVVFGSTLTIAGATNASPAVFNITAHGLLIGDLIFDSGTTGNTAINGLRAVATVPDSGHFTATDAIAGTAVNGNGVTGGTPVAVRFNMGLVPGDLDDLQDALGRVGGAGKHGPFQDKNRANESTIQTIFGQ